MVISPAAALMGIVFATIIAAPIALWFLGRLARRARGDKGALPSRRSAAVYGALLLASTLAIGALLPSMSPREFSPCAELGIADGCSAREAMKAYRRLSLVHHPDKPTGDKAKFRRIVRAYESLVDETARRNFDLHGNPEGENRAEAYGDFSKASKEEKQAVLVAYLAGFLGVAAFALVYALRAGVMNNSSESADERAERLALEAADAVAPLPGAKHGLLNHLLPNGGGAGAPPAPAPRADVLGGADFFAFFAPRFAAAEAKLKGLDAPGGWPALGDKGTPRAAVEAFYATWRGRALAKLKPVDYRAAFEAALKAGAGGAAALAERLADRAGYKSFCEQHALTENAAPFRFKSDQERLSQLINAAHAADPRLK
jgi:curved DNA-binding protein CbpA